MKNITLLYFLVLAVISYSSNSSNSSQHNLSEVKNVLFTCDHGNPIQVRFFKNNELAIFVRDGKVTELQREPSGSGFSYNNGSTIIRGKGNDLMVLNGRMAPVNCTVQ